MLCIVAIVDSTDTQHVILYKESENEYIYALI